MSRQVICERCGAEVDVRGLASHRRSYACKVGYTQKKYAAKGYVVFRGLRSNSAYYIDGLFKKDIIGYYKRGWYNFYRYGYYGPSWLHPVWELATIVRTINRGKALEMYREAINLGRPGPMFEQLNHERDFILRLAYSDLKPRYKKHILAMLLEGDQVTAKATFELLSASSP